MDKKRDADQETKWRVEARLDRENNPKRQRRMALARQERFAVKRRKRLIDLRTPGKEQCEQCGYSEEPSILVVYHLDGNQYNDSADNLRILCRNCRVKVKLLNQM